MPGNEKKDDEESKKKNIPPAPGKPRRKKKTGASNVVKIPTGKFHYAAFNYFCVFTLPLVRKGLLPCAS